MIKIYPSESGFNEINLLAELIARYKNPQLFFDLMKNIPDAERMAELSVLEDMMKELIG